MKLFTVAFVLAAALVILMPLIKHHTNSRVTDASSNGMRCNAGAAASAATTNTLTVNTGDTFGFEADIAVFHPGSFNIYMAKAPSTASSWDGSGANWFRVWERGATSITSSAITFDTTSTRLTFTISRQTPNVGARHRESPFQVSTLGMSLEFKLTSTGLFLPLTPSLALLSGNRFQSKVLKYTQLDLAMV
ncbi:hypothetical protein BDZ91DRAFT_764775 [Kalaharituber pfeilii]|nr:hypothetical protein BDZ91DRAFT_764775 [Kalaharituber pfeilii]